MSDYIGGWPKLNRHDISSRHGCDATASIEADAINAIVEAEVERAKFSNDVPLMPSAAAARHRLKPLGITLEAMKPKLTRAERVEAWIKHAAATKPGANHHTLSGLVEEAILLLGETEGST